MAVAQGNQHDDAAPVVPETVTPGKQSGNNDTTDTDTAQTVQADTEPTGLAIPFSPVAVTVQPPESTSGMTFMATTRVAQLQTAETRPLGATTTLDLAAGAQLTSRPDIGSFRELEISDAGADQPLLQPGIAAAPMASPPLPTTQLQTTTIPARVGERGWDQGLGDKLVWMASQKLQVAELRLNPADLGPLKITITLDQNQASAQFVSAHASVREAIESAMPRLREMLADSGITLGQASVGKETFHEQAQQQSGAHAAPAFATATNIGNVTTGERLLLHARGLVDTFA